MAAIVATQSTRERAGQGGQPFMPMTSDVPLSEQVSSAGDLSKSLALDLLVRLNGVAVGTLRTLLAVNEFDENEALCLVSTLGAGESYKGGGGAQPTFVVERDRSPTA